MTPTACQRWRDRRGSYRPAGEPIDPSKYAVEVVRESEARAFVQRHHYSGSFPAARTSVGLWRSRGAMWAPELVGVAVFSVCIQPRAIAKWCGTPDGVELGRFVLLDDVPANGETWFLRRAFGVMRAELQDVRAVLAYSDPVPRASVSGDVVLPGHVGTIYQAFNGRYVGRSGKRRLILDPSGRVVSGRALSKIRLGEVGADYAAAQLVKAGAPRQRPGESGAAWVTRALAEGPFRSINHPGNFAYTWPLTSDVVVPVAAGPYPKRHDAAVPVVAA